jgi:TolB-like protein
VPLFLEGSQKQIPFKEKLSLSQGRHLIVVLAENLGGQSAQRRLIIHVDREGPLITLEEIVEDREHPGQRIIVKGSLYDGAGVAYFSINGESFPTDRQREVFFAEPVILQNNKIVITARDALGNETIARIPISPGFIMGSGHLLLASSVDTNLSYLAAGLFGSKDERPPTIRLEGWADRQTVYLEKIYLEGQVADESKIVELTINDVPVLRRAGRLIFFGHFTELKEGDNLITIEARDEAGNSTINRITIRREIPVALRLDQRMSLTVIPFEQKGEISVASISFQDNLIHSLIRRNRFRVVERQLLETILQEQNLSRTKLIDRGTALKLGRLSAAQSIITGSIIESRKGIEIISRFIDTETSEILDTEDVYGEVKELQALKDLSEGLALKFHRRFPLVGGTVIQKKGKYIFTDMGEQKIGIQKRLIVYREEPVVHPVTGKILGADSEILGRARIKQVSPDMSKAELVKQTEKPVDRLDKVITE